MSVLNTSVLNGSALGSSSTGGVERVYFSGSIPMVLDASIVLPPTARYFRLGVILRLLPWAFARNFQPVVVSDALSLVCTPSLRPTHRVTNQPSDTFKLAASLNPRVLRPAPASLYGAMSLSALLNSFLSSAQPAADERTAVVAAIDRVSYSQGGR